MFIARAETKLGSDEGLPKRQVSRQSLFCHKTERHEVAILSPLSILFCCSFVWNEVTTTKRDTVINFMRLRVRCSYHRIGRQSYVSTMMTGALVAVVMVPALGLLILYVRAFAKIRQVEVEYL